MASRPLPPGNLGLPWIGETLDWTRDAFRFCEERYRKHGPVFKTRLFGTPVVCCGGPEGFTRFLDTEYFTRAGASASHIEALIGAGTLPFVEGPEQRSHKRMLLCAFRPEQLRGYLSAAAPIIERRAQEWTRRGELKLLAEVEGLVLVLFDTLFAGADPRTENQALRADLDVFIRGIAALPLPVGAYRQALRAKQRLLDYFRKAVKARRAEPRADALSAILAARDDSGRGLGDERAAAELVHLFFAGYGAISRGLTYAMMALAQNPEVRASARSEASGQGREFTLESIGRLTYLQQLWKEVLRFYPAVPHTLMARVTKPVEIGAYSVPAGWNAMGLIHATLHDPRLYKDPQRFDPDRFGPARAEDKRAENTFVAQGGGSPEGHRCLGETVSALLVKLVLAVLLPHYDWQLLSTPAVQTRFPPGPVDAVPTRFGRLAPA